MYERSAVISSTRPIRAHCVPAVCRPLRPDRDACVARRVFAAQFGSSSADPAMPEIGHRPDKLRKQYTNSDYPTVVLRFEDGHEIKVSKGTGKRFDAWSGETIKLLALYDPTSGERELIESRRADEFDDAPEGADAR